MAAACAVDFCLIRPVAGSRIDCRARNQWRDPLDTFGPLNFQPTELFKLAVILYLASLFTRREEVLRSMESLGWQSIWRGTANLIMSATNPQARRETLEMYGRFRAIILPIMLVAFGLVLIMVQPDFGSFVVITVITVGMLFLAGLPWKYFFVLVGSVLGGMVLMITAAPYRVQRVVAFLDPWKDPQVPATSLPTL